MFDNINYMENFDEDKKLEKIEENQPSVPANSNDNESAESSDGQNVESQAKQEELNDSTKAIDQALDKLDEEASNIDFDKEIIEDRLEEVREAETPKKKKKSRITNAIFLIINIVFMIFIVSGFMESYGGDLDITSIIANQGNKLWWLLGGVLMYVIFILTETGIFTTTLKATSGKRRPYLSYRLALGGKYYDNITPFSVGGEPYQIMELTKAGLNAGVATSLPLIKVIVYNLVNAGLILVAFIFGMPLVFNSGDMISNFLLLLLNFVAIIGFICTTLIGVLFILIGSGKIIGRGLARFLVKVGYKLRIVKNYRSAYNKIMRTVREYQNSMAFLKKNKLVMFKCIFLCIIQLVAYYSMPFFVVLAFANVSEITFTLWFLCFVKFLICSMASVIIPLPGGTGMMELSFMFLFGTQDLLGAGVAIGLLAWRILSYYILVVHGFTQTIIDSIVGSVKSKKSNATALK